MIRPYNVPTIYDRLYGSPFGLSPANAAQQPAVPPLPPEEEQSLLASLGEKALSGLGYIGRVLDKTFGGRAIRGLLAGKPREALSILPFSDSLGITDERDVVYGRELLQKAGMVGPNQEGFDAGDVFGFLADVALDPAMYLSPFGALTKAGKEAQKLGALPRGLENQMRGFTVAEEQLNQLPHLIPYGWVGTPQVQRQIPRGASVAPEELSRRLAATGEPLTPAVEMMATGGKTRVPGLPVDVDEFLPRATGSATPLAGALGFELPFGLGRLLGVEPQVFGTGPGAQAWAAKMAGVGDWLKGTAPIRHLRSLLSPSVRGTTTKEVQDLAANVARPEQDRLIAESLGEALDLRREIEPVVTRAGAPEVNRLLQRSAEGVPIPTTAAEYAAELQARNPMLYDYLKDAGELENLVGQWDTLQRAGQMAGQAQRRLLPLEQELGMATKELQEIGNNDVLQLLADLGLGPAPGGPQQYAMRQRTVLPPEGGGGFLRRLFRGKQPLGTTHSSQVTRDELFRQFPEGTSQINDLVRMVDADGNPLLVGRNRLKSDLEVEALLRQELTKRPGVLGSGFDSNTKLIDEATAFAAARGLPPDVADELIARATAIQQRVNQQAAELGGYLKTLDPRYATGGVDYFVSDPLTTLALRGTKSALGRSGAEALFEGVQQYARPLAEFGDEPFRRVPEVLARAGLSKEFGKASDQALEQVAKRLGLEDVKQVADLGLPQHIADDMTKLLQSGRAPSELAPVLKAYDGAMNLFKGWLTSPFPAFHVRNLFTGVYNMFRDGALDTGAMSDAKKLLQGRAEIAPLPGMKQGLSSEQVMDEVLKEVVSNRVAFTAGARRTGDVLTTPEGELKMLSESIPGRVKKAPEEVFGALKKQATTTAGPDTIPVSQVLKDMGLDTPNQLAAAQKALGADPATLHLPGSAIPDVKGVSTGEALGKWLGGWKPQEGRSVLEELNPLGIAGVRGTQDTNVVMRQMRAVQDTSENWMRVAHYIAKRRQGFNPQVAAEAVKKYHIDYSDLTGFERDVMKRLVPFYTFTSRNLPVLLEELATKPAALAGPIRAATGLRDEETFAPPYLAENVAIPIPGAPEGSMRYLSSLGLPFEDETFRALGSLAKGDMGRFWGSLLSGLTPAIKYPVEVATDTQLHTGRRLSDLQPSGAGTLLSGFNEDLAGPLSQLLAASPAGRTVSTIDKITDERKGLLEKVTNLLTGAKVTDVDVAKQKEIASRDIIQDLLKGRPGFRQFEKLYVQPEKLPMLGEAEFALYQLYKSLEAKAQKEAAIRKRESR